MKYIKEIIILILQIFMFYIFPIFSESTDPIGMVFLIILSTIILSIVLSTITNNKIKYLYPIITSIIFIPTVFIYYNSSALIHSLWYLIISSIGIIFGSIINLIIEKVTK